MERGKKKIRTKKCFWLWQSQFSQITVWTTACPRARPLEHPTSHTPGSFPPIQRNAPSLHHAGTGQAGSSRTKKPRFVVSGPRTFARGTLASDTGAWQELNCVGMEHSPFDHILSHIHCGPEMIHSFVMPLYFKLQLVFVQTICNVSRGRSELCQLCALSGVAALVALFAPTECPVGRGMWGTIGKTLKRAFRRYMG